LDERIVLSHAGYADADDARLMKEANAFFSATPSSEASMAVGPLVAFRDDIEGMDSICSVGIDSHGISGSSIVNELRIGLQTARGLDSASHRGQGRWPKEIYRTTQEAFNMGTIQGARALCMEQDIGSIAVGKKADLVIFDTMSPAMYGAAQLDPVMAIILHSSIGDVETVVVDGSVRKKEGKLVPVYNVEWSDSLRDFVQDQDGKTADWQGIASRVLEIQKRFVSGLEASDMGELVAAASSLWKLH
jgi:cytosine/adenosine deaminase-related metal-dependent hydrolase